MYRCKQNFAHQTFYYAQLKGRFQMRISLKRIMESKKEVFTNGAYLYISTKSVE